MFKPYLLSAFLLIIYGCNEDYTPKPRGYFRIDFPAKAYQKTKMDCPFSFEYPVYSYIVPDLNPNAEPCWTNLKFKSLNATVHLSYKNVDNNLYKLLEDAHAMAYKHTIKADAINEKAFSDKNKQVYALLYEIKGDAASRLQFIITDSVKHYLRGALYFNSRPNKDSLAPVINFIKPDIEHLIETFQWK